MKNDRTITDTGVKDMPLKLICDPFEEDTFWCANIFSGIRSAASRFSDEILKLDNSEISEDSVADSFPLVIGSDRDWLDRTIDTLNACRAHPVVVNAGMRPHHFRNCSGVIFGLEEMIGDCREHLLNSGKRRTALVGINRFAVSDSIKSRAFEEVFGSGDIVYADGRIEDCVNDFAATLVRNSADSFDSALCANDTAAICLSERLSKLGFDIPSDFAIIGFGNSHIGSILPVPLTSVDFDYRQLGEEAVRLVHILRDDPVRCRITFRLPCRLVVRGSTCKTAAAEKTGIVHSAEKTDKSKRLYFSGDTAADILRLEAVFQSCGDTDREILFGLLSDASVNEIADKLFFTSRAVRYRINKLTERFGFDSRAELVEFMKKTIKT